MKALIRRGSQVVIPMQILAGVRAEIQKCRGGIGWHGHFSTISLHPDFKWRVVLPGAGFEVTEAGTACSYFTCLQVLNDQQGQSHCTARFDGTRTPRDLNDGKADSPRFRHRARPLAKRPPRLRPASELLPWRSHRAGTFLKTRGVIGGLVPNEALKIVARSGLTLFCFIFVLLVTPLRPSCLMLFCGFPSS